MMQIDWSTLALQTINVVILIWLLQRFLFRPVAAIIAKREQRATSLLEQAEAARIQAESELGEAKHMRDEVESHHDKALESANADAADYKKALFEKARHQADEIVERAKVSIERQRQQEKSNTETYAAELALDIAEKLMQRLPDESRVAGFVDGLTESLEKLSTPERELLLSKDHRLRLISARELTRKEDSEVKSAIHRVLEMDVEIDSVVDTSLIAGLELEGPHCEVRNSFRADIAHIKEKLIRDDQHAT